VLNVGSSVVRLSNPGSGASSSGVGFPRIRRWRSSRPCSSSSSSESESKVSARVRSSWGARGSSDSRRREVGEEARERKDGGGEAGGHCCCAAAGESTSSSAATFGAVSRRSCAGNRYSETHPFVALARHGGGASASAVGTEGRRVKGSAGCSRRGERGGERVRLWLYVLALVLQAARGQSAAHGRWCWVGVEGEDEGARTRTVAGVPGGASPLYPIQIVAQQL
jgi:hypothetical protein